MGQKVNPIGLRLGINRTWDSRWYAGKKDYGKLLQEDIKIREYLSEKLKAAGVSRIVIERPHKKCRVTIHSARPGVVIGKKGADIEKLKSDVQKYTTDEVHLNIVEIRKPEIDAKLVAENIAQQLERRVAFRRVMKRSVQTAMRLGALGIRITCSATRSASCSRGSFAAPTESLRWICGTVPMAPCRDSSGAVSALPSMAAAVDFAASARKTNLPWLSVS